jgi:hypothetical protein
MDEKKNEDSFLDSYLRANVPLPPPGRLGEKQKIWQAILAAQEVSQTWRALFARPVFKVAVPALALILPLLIVTTVLHHRKSAHDAAVERILSSVLLEDDFTDPDQDIF